MPSGKAREWYRKRKNAIKRMYWEKTSRNDILWPNGFREYPWEIYDLFASLIDRDGKVLDLGCGNGLMLKHLIEHSGYRLEPYGVDFIEESIEQAKTIVLPEYSENFTVANIAEYSLPPKSFDFIFIDPSSVHKDDIDELVNNLIEACKPGGKIIFYTYRDVLRVLKIISIISLILPPLRKRLPYRIRGIIRWTGDLLPRGLNLERIEHRHVSIGVYSCKPGNN